jgi:hypothetical protein
VSAFPVGDKSLRIDIAHLVKSSMHLKHVMRSPICIIGIDPTHRDPPRGMFGPAMRYAADGRAAFFSPLSRLTL